FGSAADCDYAGGVMKATPTLTVLLLLLCGWPGSLGAQSNKQVKVVFEFRLSGTQSREAVQGSGRVVITERGGTQPSGRVAADSAQRRVPRAKNGRAAGRGKG